MEAKVNMTPPKNIKQVCAFVGLVNCYMDMCYKRSHLLQPLNLLTSNKVDFKWTDVEQSAFGEIKQIVACDILLIYPDCNKRFYIHADASNFHPGLLII